MNKRINDLGAVWTKKQWEKTEKQIAKQYSALQVKANKLGKWNY
jgi:hypothetical protein